jgi:NTP pyrophosphatase (non-canonical NTP hydrolase)
MNRINPINLTFADVSRINLARCNEWHNLNDWTLSDWLTATCGELGELANVIKKANRVNQNIKSSNNPLSNEIKDKMIEEIGGTFLYLDLLAQRANLELQFVIPLEFNRVSKRENLDYLITI